MAPTNNAAFIVTEKARPIEVKASIYTSPGAKEITIKNAAIGINPMDWVIQLLGSAIFDWIEYPFVGGSDVAGEVVEVGSSVTRFKPGDRVVGHAFGFSNRNTHESAFQNYTVLQDHMVSPIPDSVTYESAAVLPLGLSTAACGLYQKDYLALQYPSTTPKSTGETLLIWAGSSSVGANAIQLAVASGYEVITTASPSNFDFVKKLGASQVFDYNSSTVTEDLIAAFKGKKSAGAMAILPGSDKVCGEVVHKSEGNKFVAMCLPPPWAIPEGIKANFVFGGTLKDNEVGSLIYEHFLPKALAEGKYLTVPEPLVVGKGLESIQAAQDRHQQGVSARKVVVTL